MARGIVAKKGVNIGICRWVVHTSYIKATQSWLTVPGDTIQVTFLCCCSHISLSSILYHFWLGCGCKEENCLWWSCSSNGWQTLRQLVGQAQSSFFRMRSQDTLATSVDTDCYSWLPFQAICIGAMRFRLGTGEQFFPYQGCNYSKHNILQILTARLIYPHHWHQLTENILCCFLSGLACTYYP